MHTPSTQQQWHLSFNAREIRQRAPPPFYPLRLPSSTCIFLHPHVQKQYSAGGTILASSGLCRAMIIPATRRVFLKEDVSSQKRPCFLTKHLARGKMIFPQKKNSCLFRRRREKSNTKRLFQASQEKTTSLEKRSFQFVSCVVFSIYIHYIIIYVYLTCIYDMINSA